MKEKSTLAAAHDGHLDLKGEDLNSQGDNASDSSHSASHHDDSNPSIDLGGKARGQGAVPDKYIGDLTEDHVPATKVHLKRPLLRKNTLSCIPSSANEIGYPNLDFLNSSAGESDFMRRVVSTSKMRKIDKQTGGGPRAEIGDSEFEEKRRELRKAAALKQSLEAQNAVAHLKKASAVKAQPTAPLNADISESHSQAPEQKVMTKRKKRQELSLARIEEMIRQKQESASHNGISRKVKSYRGQMLSMDSQMHNLKMFKIGDDKLRRKIAKDPAEDPFSLPQIHLGATQFTPRRSDQFRQVKSRVRSLALSAKQIGSRHLV